MPCQSRYILRIAYFKEMSSTRMWWRQDQSGVEQVLIAFI